MNDEDFEQMLEPLLVLYRFLDYQLGIKYPSMDATAIYFYQQVYKNAIGDKIHNVYYCVAAYHLATKIKSVGQNIPVILNNIRYGLNNCNIPELNELMEGIPNEQDYYIRQFVQGVVSAENKLVLKLNFCFDPPYDQYELTDYALKMIVHWHFNDKEGKTCIDTIETRLTHYMDELHWFPWFYTTPKEVVALGFVKYIFSILDLKLESPKNHEWHEMIFPEINSDDIEKSHKYIIDFFNTNPDKNAPKHKESEKVTNSMRSAFTNWRIQPLEVGRSCEDLCPPPKYQLIIKKAGDRPHLSQQYDHEIDYKLLKNTFKKLHHDEISTHNKLVIPPNKKVNSFKIIFRAGKGAKGAPYYSYVQDAVSLMDQLGKTVKVYNLWEESSSSSDDEQEQDVESESITEVDQEPVEIEPIKKKEVEKKRSPPPPQKITPEKKVEIHRPPSPQVTPQKAYVPERRVEIHKTPSLQHHHSPPPPPPPPPPKIPPKSIMMSSSSDELEDIVTESESSLESSHSTESEHELEQEPKPEPEPQPVKTPSPPPPPPPPPAGAEFVPKLKVRKSLIPPPKPKSSPSTKPAEVSVPEEPKRVPIPRNIEPEKPMIPQVRQEQFDSRNRMPLTPRNEDRAIPPRNEDRAIPARIEERVVPPYGARPPIGKYQGTPSPMSSQTEIKIDGPPVPIPRRTQFSRENERYVPRSRVDSQPNRFYRQYDNPQYNAVEDSRPPVEEKDDFKSRDRYPLTSPRPNQFPTKATESPVKDPIKRNMPPSPADMVSPRPTETRASSFSSQFPSTYGDGVPSSSTRQESARIEPIGRSTESPSRPLRPIPVNPRARPPYEQGNRTSETRYDNGASRVSGEYPTRNSHFDSTSPYNPNYDSQTNYSSFDQNQRAPQYDSTRPRNSRPPEDSVSPRKPRPVPEQPNLDERYPKHKPRPGPSSVRPPGMNQGADFHQYQRYNDQLNTYQDYYNLMDFYGQAYQDGRYPYVSNFPSQHMYRENRDHRDNRSNHH